MQAPQMGARPMASQNRIRPQPAFLGGGVGLGKQQRGRPTGVFLGGRSGTSHAMPHVATLPHHLQQNSRRQPQQQAQQQQQQPGALGAASAAHQHQQQQQPHPRGGLLAARAKKGDDDAAAAGGGDDDEELKKDWKFGRNEGPMDWRWKLCCAILYMLPWVDVTEKTVYFIERFPAFHWAEYFTEPFEHWFYIHEWAPLIIFFGTYLGIVRNKKIPHVARYHIMMGIMLDIVAMILIVVEENLPFGALWTPWSDLFYALMFWFVFLLVVYCLFFCFVGWYCEIPLISEGVYIQIEQAESMGAA